MALLSRERERERVRKKGASFREREGAWDFLKMAEEGEEVEQSVLVGVSFPLIANG